jgi:nitric oxide reductase subunit B
MDTLQLPKQDNTAKTLIILLILVTIGCWLTMIWSTYRTYQEAPPIPKVMVSTNHQSIMTLEDIVQGKEGFQKADLMDYGSLYGMGSYFGEDYTAQYLVELSQENMK